MGSPEFQDARHIDPKLSEILDLYGNVILINHQGEPQTLRQAVDECPPLADVLLNAESPEQLRQIIDSLKAPE